MKLTRRGIFGCILGAAVASKLPAVPKPEPLPPLYVGSLNVTNGDWTVQRIRENQSAWCSTVSTGHVLNLDELVRRALPSDPRHGS